MPGGDTSITASFTGTTHTITAAAGANGAVSATDNGTACPSNVCAAPTGATVVITATAATGYQFSSWTGTLCAGKTATCTINVTATTPTETETATFTATTHTITASAGANGAVSATDNGTACPSNVCAAPTGATVVITTTPATGYQFSSWTGTLCAGQTATCTINVTATTPTQTETASFTGAPLTITYGGANGTVTATDAGVACTGGTCNAHGGDAIVLTATANSFYKFSGWNTGGTCTGTTNPCTFTATKIETDTALFTLSGTLDPATAVYVSPSGSDGNSGTAASPVATPGRGLAIAAGSSGAKNQVWIAQGTYSGPLALTAADDGLQVYGNFSVSGSTWTQSTTTPSATTISGSPEGLIANGAAVSFFLVNFAGHAPSGPSSSAYGVVALSGSNITLSGASVTTGDGSAGVNGGAGTPGLPGGAGGAGGAGQTPAQVAAACLASNGTRCDPVDGSGGKAGLGVNGNDYFVLFAPPNEKNPLLHAMTLALPAPTGGPSAGDGGFGGYGNTHSTSTLQGCTGKGKTLACGPERMVKKRRQVIGTYYGGWGSTPVNTSAAAAEGGGGKPGYANLAGDGFAGSNGTDAANGVAGADGSPGSSASPAGPTWTPGNGTAGSSGGPGAGGGGGGGGGGNIALVQTAQASGSGNGGGGGGGGGSGGTGGGAGAGGGGSFGVYLDGASNVTIVTGSTVAAGNGGAGGNGGPGGAGGAGGTGGAGGSDGVPEEGAGGNGGNGSDGGPGGAGGGGAGGPSIAVYAADASSTPQIESGTPLKTGSGGSGGHSGATGGSPQLAPSGASVACLGNCKSIKSLPLVLPALGLVHNGSVVAQLECEAACHGTGSLQLLGVGGHGFARTSFRLGAKGFATLHMTLSKAVRARFGHSKSLLVELTVTATVVGSGPDTYVTMLDLARTAPKPRPHHK